MTDMKPCAAWSDDYGGKQDYDGRLLSISTRYWPGFKSRDGRPSAKASIVLNHGEPDQYGFNDYAVWREREFSAETEAEVKAAVEAWVQEQFDEVRSLLHPLAQP